jgi:hypothetical protein
MKELYISPEIEIIKFTEDEEIKTLATTSAMDGTDIRAVWLRG